MAPCGVVSRRSFQSSTSFRCSTMMQPPKPLPGGSFSWIASTNSCRELDQRAQKRKPKGFLCHQRKGTDLAPQEVDTLMLCNSFCSWAKASLMYSSYPSFLCRRKHVLSFHTFTWQSWANVTPFTGIHSLNHPNMGI